MLQIEAVLCKTGKTNQRKRDLPAHVVIYYVIALTLYMNSSYREVLRCLMEGIRWLLGPEATIKAAGKSFVSPRGSRNPTKDDQLCVFFPLRSKKRFMRQ
jgi:hypothetical protein